MNYSKREKFSIRKTTLGAVSVQLATLFATASLVNVTVAADAVEPAATEAVAETQEGEAVTQEDINQAQAELDTAQTALNQAQENLTKASQTEQEAAAEDKRLQDLNELADQVTPEMVDEQKDLEVKLTEEVKADKTALDEKKTQVKQAEGKEKTAKQALDQTQQKVETTTATVTSLTADIKTLNNEVAELNKDISSNQAAAKTAEETIKTQSVQVETQTKTVTTLENKLAEAVALDKDIKKVEADTQLVEGQISKLKMENPDLEILFVSYPLEFFEILKNNPNVLMPYPQGSGGLEGRTYDEYLNSLDLSTKDKADIYRMLELAESVKTTYVPTEADKNHLIAGPQLTTEEVWELNITAVKWLNQATKAYREANGLPEYEINPLMTKVMENHSNRMLEQVKRDGSLIFGHQLDSTKLSREEMLEATNGTYKVNGENAGWDYAVNQITGVKVDPTTKQVMTTWSPVTMATVKESLITTLHRLFGNNFNPEFQHLNGLLVPIENEKRPVMALNTVVVTNEGKTLTNMSQGVGIGFYFNNITATGDVHHEGNIKVGEHGVASTVNTEQVKTLTTTLNNLKAEQARLVAKQTFVGNAVAVQTQLNTARQNLKDAETKTAAAEKALKDAKAEESKLKASLTVKNALVTTKQAELDKAAEELSALKTDLLSKQDTYAKAQEELKTAQSQEAAAEAKLTQSSQALQTASQKHQHYQELLADRDRLKAELKQAQQALTLARETRQAAQEALTQALAVRDDKQAILTDLKSRYLAPILDNQGEPAPEKEQETVHLPVQLPVTGQQPETGQPVAGSGGFAAAGRIIQAVSANRPTTGQARPTYSRTARAAEQALPKTGETGSVLSFIGLGLASLGVLGRKRRKA